MKNENLRIFDLQPGQVVDIPPDGGSEVAVCLKRLYASYVSDNHFIPYSVKQARLFEHLIAEGLDLPRMKNLGLRVVSSERDRVNELLGSSTLPGTINRLSQKRAIIRAPSFIHFKNVKVAFGNTGVCIYRDGEIDPVSTAIVKSETFQRESNRSIRRGLITIDRFGSDNICHFVFDCLGRERAFRLYDDNDEQAFVMLPKMMPPYQASFVQNLTNVAHFESGDIVHFNDLYVSTDITTEFDDGFSHPSNNGNHRILKALRDLAPISKKKELPKKIYLSRRDSDRRVLENEKELELFLEARGFYCVALSDLTCGEQLGLLEGADIVVAQHGAALTNILACRKDTKIVELFNVKHGTDAYEILSKNLGLDYNMYQMGGGSKSQNSIIDLDDFAAFLSDRKID